MIHYFSILVTHFNWLILNYEQKINFSLQSTEVFMTVLKSFANKFQATRFKKKIERILFHRIDSIHSKDRISSTRAKCKLFCKLVRTGQKLLVDRQFYQNMIAIIVAWQSNLLLLQNNVHGIKYLCSDILHYKKILSILIENGRNCKSTKFFVILQKKVSNENNVIFFILEENTLFTRVEQTRWINLHARLVEKNKSEIYLS